MTTLLGIVAFIAVYAFSLWCAYDFGDDRGYSRCWWEHHPDPASMEGEL